MKNLIILLGLIILLTGCITTKETKPQYTMYEITVKEAFYVIDANTLVVFGKYQDSESFQVFFADLREEYLDKILNGNYIINYIVEHQNFFLNIRTDIQNILPLKITIEEYQNLIKKYEYII
jgi:hypothetical protein